MMTSSPPPGSERAFVLFGTACALVQDPDVRAGDLSRNEVTLARTEDGSVFTVSAAEFMGPAAPGEGLLSPSRRYAFRELLERVLAAGFDERWIALIGRFVRDHRLLQDEPEAQT